MHNYLQCICNVSYHLDDLRRELQLLLFADERLEDELFTHVGLAGLVAVHTQTRVLFRELASLKDASYVDRHSR